MTETKLKTRPVQPSLKPVIDPHRIHAIIEAAESFDLTKSGNWTELRELSSRTEVEAIEPDLDGLFEADRAFEAIGSVFLKLSYGKESESLSMIDSLPFHVFGRFDQSGTAVIDDFKVDMSAFYS